jgi:hypothetical protein
LFERQAAAMTRRVRADALAARLEKWPCPAR